MPTIEKRPESVGTKIAILQHGMDAKKYQTSALIRRDPRETIELSVRGALDYLFLYKWWIALPTVAATIVAAAIMLLTPNQYRSSATILPSGQNEGVSSLKDLVGLGSMGMVDENSSQLYPLILRSQQLKNALQQRTYVFRTENDSLRISLAQYFKETDPNRLSRAIDDITTISTGKRTGEMVLQVKTIYPALSQMLATAYIEELETFNRFKRATTAGSNQRYLEKQLATTSAILDTAERKLEAFRRVNSDWAMTSDAETLTELGRLQREVELQSTALMYLRQQFEAARLTAQKDVPIVRILDYPNLPTLKVGPQRTKVCLLTAILTSLSMIFGLFAFAIGREFLHRESNDDHEHSDSKSGKSRLVLRNGATAPTTEAVYSSTEATPDLNRIRKSVLQD